MTPVWEYSESDFIFKTRWDTSSLSKFDEVLQECWNRKQNEDILRYKLNVRKSKFVGKHRLFLQLNPERGSFYRMPQKFVSINQPFNADAFNFTKIKEEEKMFELKSKDLTGCDNVLAVNVSPLQRGHILILPSLYACLPQVMTEESLRISLDVLLLSASPALRVIYNSPCAFASVNHLHFHSLYVDKKMVLEKIRVEHLSGPCYELVDFPSKGFMFELTSGSPEVLRSNVFKLVSFFQERNIAHNLCMTRGYSQKLSSTLVESNLTNENVRDCVRVYIWGRTPSYGSKDSFEINPAACELFGLITTKTEKMYESMSEEDAEKILDDITASVFESVRNDVKALFTGAELS